MDTVELDGRPWIMARDAARLGGIGIMTIYQNIHRGRLRRRFYLGRIVVSLDEVVTLWPRSEPEPVAEEGEL